MREEIIKMAREAGLPYEYDTGRILYLTQLERFFHMAQAAEREACAKVAENRFLDKASCTAEEMYELQKKSIAADIRARG